MPDIVTISHGAAETQAHELHCMEIWGGIEAANQAVSSGGLDMHVFAEPWRGEQTGGDIHYLSMCGSGHITRFFVADVSGHGEQVGELAVTLRKLLRRHMNTLDTSKLASAVNGEFVNLAEEGRFATALMCTYFSPTHQLVVVNAGHPRPLWWVAKRGEWRFLEASAGESQGHGPRNLPLGVIGETGYRQFVVTLEPGDVVMMYTDSLMEATDAAGRMLGEKGLLEMVRACSGESGIAKPQAAPGSCKARDVIAGLPAPGSCKARDGIAGLPAPGTPGTPGTPGSTEVGRSLLEKVRAYQGGAAFADDVTLVTVAHAGAEPRPITLGERLTAMAKMVGLMGT